MAQLNILLTRWHGPLLNDAFLNKLLHVTDWSLVVPCGYRSVIDDYSCIASDLNVKSFENVNLPLA